MGELLPFRRDMPDDEPFISENILAIRDVIMDAIETTSELPGVDDAWLQSARGHCIGLAESLFNATSNIGAAESDVDGAS